MRLQAEDQPAAVMQSILVRNYNLTCVAWDIEMCISTEEIIIMKDGKLFLFSVRSFSHLRIQIFYLINHFCCINKCVEMLSKKVLNEAFRSSVSSVRLQRELFEFCVHPCVDCAAGEVTELRKQTCTGVHSNTENITRQRELHVVDQIEAARVNIFHINNGTNNQAMCNVKKCCCQG